MVILFACLFFFIWLKKVLVAFVIVVFYNINIDIWIYCINIFLIIWKKQVKINCVISSQQQLQEELDSTSCLARNPCRQARCDIFSSLPLKQHVKWGCSVITLLMLLCARAARWLSTGLITHAAQMAAAGRAHNRPLRGSCDSGREAGRHRARPLETWCWLWIYSSTGSNISLPSSLLFIIIFIIFQSFNRNSLTKQKKIAEKKFYRQR